MTNRRACLPTAYPSSEAQVVIVGGMLMMPGQGPAVQLATGWLRVEAGQIAQVGWGDCPHGLDLGGPDCLVLPGLIDAHLHLPQFDSIGCDGLPLLEWLEQVIFPAEVRWEDAGYAAEMTDRVLDQLLSLGTTSFCGYATVHHAATAAAMRRVDARGMRAAVGQVLMDTEAPEELCRPAAALLDETQRLLQRYPPGQARLEAAITPRFAVSCTRRLLEGAGALAAASGAMVQTHIAENLAECELVHHLFGGLAYAEVYRQAGLLGPRCLLAHGIHLQPQERHILAGHRAAVVHCPAANLFLQSGVMPLRRWQQEGLSIAMGSDVGAGPERSMVRTAQAMIEAAKFLGLSDPQLAPPRAAEAWWQITAGNADAAGWPMVGRLAVGAEADLLVVRPDIRWNDAADPLSTLLFAWDDRWLRQTIVAGQVAYTADPRTA